MYNMFQLIRALCSECYIQLKVVEERMRKCYTETIQYQNKLWTRQTLERLKLKNVGTLEIQRIAAISSKHSLSKSIFSEIVSENMKLKLKDAIFNEKIAKSNMIHSKIELKNYVKPNSIAGVEFNRLIDLTWNTKWKTNSLECFKKVEGLELKQESLMGKSKKRMKV